MEQVNHGVFVSFKEMQPALIDELLNFPREQFIVYGYDKNQSVKNIQYKSFSHDGFLDDLRQSNGVIASAGFSLMTEALYLKKPFLAIPLQGQFEQLLNGFLMEKLGYGKCITSLTSEDISAFLYHRPDYRDKLSGYTHTGNEAIKAMLDRLISDDAKELRKFCAD